MKKIIITGCARTGSTALVYLLNQSKDVLVTNELAAFHYSDQAFNKTINNEFVVNEARRSAGDKNWNINDIINLRNGLIENTNFKFMGDKRPDYCSGFAPMNFLIENHQDAYFIFTHRDPCATAHSFLKRSRIEKDTGADWYALTYDAAANTIVNRTNNWLSTLYPNVKNKLIVNYDDFIEKPANLVQVLENFLGDNLEIKQPELTYCNKNYFAYKLNMSDREQNIVNYKFSILKEKIDSLTQQPASH